MGRQKLGRTYGRVRWELLLGRAATLVDGAGKKGVWGEARMGRNGGGYPAVVPGSCATGMVGRRSFNSSEGSGAMQHEA